MKKQTPLKAIREKCLDCSASQPLEVRLCPVVQCALHPYRMGKNPEKVFSDEELLKRSERMKKTLIKIREKQGKGTNNENEETV